MCSEFGTYETATTTKMVAVESNSTLIRTEKKECNSKSGEGMFRGMTSLILVLDI